MEGERIVVPCLVTERFSVECVEAESVIVLFVVVPMSVVARHACAGMKGGCILHVCRDCGFTVQICALCAEYAGA